MTADTAAAMQRAAELLDAHFNGTLRGKERLTGFVLIAFPFGDGPRDASYVTNADAVLPVVKRLIDRLEKRSVQ